MNTRKRQRAKIVRAEMKIALRKARQGNSNAAIFYIYLTYMRRLDLILIEPYKMIRRLHKI